MTVLEGILVAIRWAHALAAVAWVGGSIFFLLVLRPSLKRANGGGPVGRLAGAEFRSLVNTAIAVLVLTGVVLSLSRLTSTAVSVPYVVVLVGKIIVALYMFSVAWLLRRRDTTEAPGTRTGPLTRIRRGLVSPEAVLVGGIIAIGLADVLDALFEMGLSK
jgi:uncharacterized membrane protein